ncbi:MAG: LysR family transcriptional regulator, partial [Pseudomonadota bacterium]
MNRFEDIAAFEAVVEKGSFSAAARSLGLTPSAVSKQISHLEERLGARLFNRTTRSVHLTEEGQVFHDRAHVALEVLEEAESAVSTLTASPSGHLRVTMPASFGMIHVAPILNDFMAANPKISLEIESTNRFVDIVNEGYDVAIRVGVLQDSTLRARRLRPFRWVVCAAPSYLKAHGSPSEPGDLVNHQCLLLTHSTRHWPFTGPEGDFTVRVSGSLSAADSQLVSTVLLDGGGIARMSSYVVTNELHKGTLVPILTDYGWHEETHIYAVYPATRHPSPKVRAFIDYLATHLHKPEDWEVEGTRSAMVSDGID